MKYGIVGATGRVGQLVVKILMEEGEELGAVMFQGRETIQFPRNTLITNDGEELLKNCEIVIDFSSPIATKSLLTAGVKFPKPMVIGTTGLTDEHFQLMEQISQKVPIFYATNMSIGIALLNQLVKMVAQKVPDYDIEIVEQHHRWKVDAPSGTALTLAQSVATGRNWNLEEVLVTGRKGEVGARRTQEIGVLAVRGGDVVGRHTVGFYGEGEFLELNHTATSRETGWFLFNGGFIRILKEENVFSSWNLQQP